MSSRRIQTNNTITTPTLPIKGGLMSFLQDKASFRKTDTIHVRHESSTFENETIVLNVNGIAKGSINRHVPSQKLVAPHHGMYGLKRYL